MDKEKNVNEEKEEVLTEKEEIITEEVSEVQKLENKVKELEEELAKAKNDYFKAYADAENMKRRYAQDYQNSMKYRIQSFASEVIPVLDNFERALSQKSENEEVKNYTKGFEMIHSQLVTLLKNEGVEEIEALNLPFDPAWHQSIMSEAREGVESGIVLEVLQKGYKLKDRVLRASLVKISE